MKKEIISNVFVIVLTAIFILCANFAYYDMTKKIYFELMIINKILSFAIGGNPLPSGGGRSLVNL